MIQHVGCIGPGCPICARLIQPERRRSRETLKIPTAGSPPPPVSAPAPAPHTRKRFAPLPCVHLGEPTGEERPCYVCGGRTATEPLNGCAVHGACSRTRQLAGVQCCRICPDFVKKEDA